MAENQKNEQDVSSLEEKEFIGKKAYKEKLLKKDEEIEKLKKEIEKWKNDYYLAFADTQNLRKALEKDYSNALKYRAEGFLEKLLPVIDSFNLALQSKPTNPALLNYLTGFEYIYKNIVSALESEGVSEIRPQINSKFDASTMNAIDTVLDDGEENLVKQIYCVGIKLHDRIIRHANVVVSKKPQEKTNIEKTEETQA